MNIKEIKKTILYDLQMLKDRESEDWEYHYRLLRGNIKDLFRHLNNTKE